ncbi:MAG TPA: hypothetical protein VF595_10205 [Tepidisphaeraceae bacterium]|jgi:tRNA A-37 threonylcarbamoyl transferase component Bud32
MPDGITIDKVLKPDVTWRARDAAGTRVVLKRLPDDCLRDGRLHPSIRLRLTRLRDAPVGAMANLIGVEVVDGRTVMVSEYVRGEPLDARPIEARAAHLPEARRLIAALHAVGLVHGAVGLGNFIIDRAGRLRLIDPSPFLYDDPAVDLDALARLEPDEMPDDARDAASDWHLPSLAAAAALTLLAVAAAAGWTLHLAGRP